MKIYSYPNSLFKENWESITVAKTQSADLGLISATSTDQEDYGGILDLVEYDPAISIFGGSDLQINRYQDYGKIAESNFSIYESYGSLGSVSSGIG